MIGLRRKNTHISLFHLLVFCLAVLPGSLLHNHHGHGHEEALNACQLHIEYNDLAISGKCGHTEHFSAEGDHCFACQLHYNPLFTEAQGEISFKQSELCISISESTQQLLFSEHNLNFNKGPPVSV